MLETINNYIWNAGLLVLLLGTGVYITVKTGFFQLRGAGYILKKIYASLKGKGSEGVSQWRVCMSALAASMGTGNIVGVTAALSIGGAGAIFWMWCSAFFGMALTYGENVLSFRYRKNESGSAGACAYIKHGLGMKWLGWLYSLFCVLAAFGMGNMTQSSAAASALEHAFGIPPYVTGLVIMLLLVLAVLGGIKSVGKVTGFLLPFAAAGYMLTALAVIILNIERVPAAFAEIVSEAFGIRQLSGGGIGAAISAGMRHGVFSNEAGLGSSGLIHSSAQDDDKYLQGMWSVFEVFLDTMVCCTLTALAVLCTDVPVSHGSQPVAEAFSCVLGEYSEGAVGIMIALFAVCTMLGWCCCGETALTSLSKGKSTVYVYRAAFCICAMTGAMGALSDVWTLSDIANGLMALPNLLALLCLSKYIDTPDGWRKNMSVWKKSVKLYKTDGTA